MSHILFALVHLVALSLGWIWLFVFSVELHILYATIARFWRSLYTRIRCPHCGSSELAEESKCSYCGANLSFGGSEELGIHYYIGALVVWAAIGFAILVLNYGTMRM